MIHATIIFLSLVLPYTAVLKIHKMGIFAKKLKVTIHNHNRKNGILFSNVFVFHCNFKNGTNFFDH
jgi:hypothetical protein